MSGGLEVLLVTTEQPVIEAVGASLMLDRNTLHNRVRPTCQELTYLLQNHATGVVLVDIDPAPAQILGQIDQLTRSFAQVRFIVLSSTLSSDLMLGAMQAGARHFICKDQIGGTLRSTLSKLADQQRQQCRGHGQIFTMLSASGGCGTTTLAINLAGELQQRCGQPALIVDLDTAYGGAASYLGLSGDYGVADVLGHPGTIDSQLLATTTVSYHRTLDVLLSPASVRANRTTPLQTDCLPQLLNVCSANYPCTVLDAPRVGPDTAVMLLSASTTSFLVIQLSVKDIRSARTMLQELDARHVARSQITVLVNRHRSKYAKVSLEEARKALDGMTFQTVDNDFSSAIRAQDYGQLLSESVPRSALRKQIAAWAEQLAELGARHALARGRGEG